MSRLSFDLEERYWSQIDALFDKFGYTEFLNQFAFWPFLVICSVGFVTNLFGLVVSYQLANINKCMGLYRYMQVYCLNSAVCCAIQSCTFVLYSQRMFPWTVSREAFIFIIWIYLPVLYGGYFYGSLIDIFMTLDKISSLKPGFKWIKPSRITYLCLATFGIVCVLHAPCTLTFQSNPLNISLYSTDSNGSVVSNEAVTWWLPGLTPFSSSRVGNLRLLQLIRSIV